MIPTASMSTIPLSDLPVGTVGCLAALDHDATPLRLRELGFVPGTLVTVVRRGFLGDPLELELRGYRICLRRDDLVGLRVAPRENAA